MLNFRLCREENINKMKIQTPTEHRQCGGEERLLPFGYENSHRQQLPATCNQPLQVQRQGGTDNWESWLHRLRCKDV